jgi:hypothetical protein
VIDLKKGSDTTVYANTLHKKVNVDTLHTASLSLRSHRVSRRRLHETTQVLLWMKTTYIFVSQTASRHISCYFQPDTSTFPHTISSSRSRKKPFQYYTSKPSISAEKMHFPLLTFLLSLPSPYHPPSPPAPAPPTLPKLSNSSNGSW